MVRVIAFISLVTGLLGMTIPAHSQDTGSAYVKTIKDLVRYTLVYLKVTGKLPDGSTIPEIYATGFLVSEDGHVVTAKHVALSQTRWEQHTSALSATNNTALTFAQSNFTYEGRLNKDDAQSFSLSLISASETADIAVLRLKTFTSELRQKEWPILPIASLTSANKSMPVAAWGFPAAAYNDVQYGGEFASRISGIGILYDGHELVEANLGFQAGASGGPVFNKRGQIVGVIYGGRALQPTSYFTPGNILVKFLDQLGVVR